MGIGPDGRLAYFVTDTLPGIVLELSEESGFKEKSFLRTADIGTNWKGSDPVGDDSKESYPCVPSWRLPQERLCRASPGR